MVRWMKRYDREDKLDMPIRKIVDGYVLETGELYLTVETEPNKFATVTLPIRRN